ncbi:MAG: caspase family protein [Treponema sp.]|jgi:hypothetical protein|nr:caspase family protein [Treponema sp.]
MIYGKRRLFFTITLLAFVSLSLWSQDVTRRLGLFIGSNNGGRGRVMLRYAVSDARAVSRVFSDMGGIATEDNIILVEPSVAEINRKLDAISRELASSRRSSQRTELVFYYSGHSDEDGLLLNRQRYGYRELRDRINRIDTDMRIVILDSCSSGAITRAKGGVKTPPFLFDNSVSVEGYAYLTSSSADEASQESDLIESSYFTHSLVADLRGAADTVGDGKVTLNELYRFAYAETLSMTETSLYGAQHPSYDMQLSGSGDVILTDINETSAGILIDGELTGRITIRDSSDFLVAELTKVNQRPMELGLSPGLYRIIIQRGDNFYRAEVLLWENTRTPLAMADFSRIASAPRGRSRGTEDASSSSEGAVFSFFVNIVPEQFRFPLFGFVNIARGNQSMPQFGFVNWNTGSFTGFHASFINTVGGDVNGVQVGFVNTVAGNTNGTQIAFVNTTAKDNHGFQFGFVNITAQKMKGMQFGFVNYADSFEDGIPIGFISVVRNGGYWALEYAFSEFYSANIGFKIGVEKFYATFYTAYDLVNGFSPASIDHLASGLGFGSIIPINSSFFFNPELIGMSSFFNNINRTSFIPFFGYNISKRFAVTAGPSVTWVHYQGDTEPQKPLFRITEYVINDNNSIVVGARAALRLRF